MERVQKVISNCGYTSRRDAEELIKKGKSKANKQFIMYVLKNDLDKNFLGISVSKKVGNSVDDNRNFVKKAVNWAIRSIGKKNIYLNQRAIELSYDILKEDSKSAKWIAKNAIKELESEKVKNKLNK